MYIESTSKHPTDKARLFSPQMPKTPSKCVQFWYHMYGSSIGTLSLYKKTGQSNGPRIWTLKGDQGDEWLIAQVTVWSPLRPFRLTFEGTGGSGNKGDIAIDDVEIFNGRCAAPGG